MSLSYYAVHLSVLLDLISSYVEPDLYTIRKVTNLVYYLDLRSKNNVYSCSQSRTTDQMCRQQSWGPLTAEESLAAEESLTIYCKPVELYNILQRRALRNVKFLFCWIHELYSSRTLLFSVPFSSYFCNHQMYVILYVLCCSHCFSKDACITRYKQSTNGGTVIHISVFVEQSSLLFLCFFFSLLCCLMIVHVH